VETLRDGFCKLGGERTIYSGFIAKALKGEKAERNSAFLLLRD
jgi:hypothetical protein